MGQAVRPAMESVQVGGQWAFVWYSAQGILTLGGRVDQSRLGAKIQSPYCTVFLLGKNQGHS